jgi:3-oxoacyl-(acyl-carrier-protein) synthase
VITGLAVISAFGRGIPPLLDHAFAGEPAFTQVTRFDVSRRRARAAAHMPGAPVLAQELASTVDKACADAGLTVAERASCPLLLAARADPADLRHQANGRPPGSPATMAAAIAAQCGLSRLVRAYTGACIASSTAAAAAASAIRSRASQRIAVAAGYLVDADQFALFDAARALADDGQVRPFSKGRRGTLLGDGVVALVLESASAARLRGARVLARLAGWGRAGDAHDVSRPHPGGAGLGRAIRAALNCAGVTASQIGYVNANGTGAVHSDSSESAALRGAFGRTVADVPVSATKSVHGHALEASALLELVMTLLALRTGRLPVNAGFIEPDEQCPLNLILQRPRPASARYALTLNAALGGANTALVVAAP